MAKTKSILLHCEDRWSFLVNKLMWKFTTIHLNPMAVEAFLMAQSSRQGRHNRLAPHHGSSVSASGGCFKGVGIESGTMPKGKKNSSKKYMVGFFDMFSCVLPSCFFGMLSGMFFCFLCFCPKKTVTLLP